MNSEWNVVYTYPRCEKKVYMGLSDKNIQAYLPYQNVVRQWSDRKKKMQVPLFPNYVFVCVYPSNRGHVLSVEGITRFISFEGRPARVEEKEINKIRLMTDGQYDVSPEPRLSLGDMVRVTGGPLIGLEGRLIRKNGAHRLYVYFDLMGQGLSIDIQRNPIEKVLPETQLSLMA